jgi:BlaI family penicillinase repressor
MPPKPPNRPTDAELAVLRVLWDEGPSTVKAVQGRLSAQVGYTTVLKTLQIMTEKGLVRRDETQRAHVYQAAVDEEATQRHLLGDLLDRAYKGSASRLVMQALSGRPASKREIAEIQRFLEEAAAAKEETDHDE